MWRVLKSWFGKKPAPLARQTAIEGIPLLVPGVECIEQDNGQVRLIIQRKPPKGWMAKRVYPNGVPPIQLELDDLGSSVIRLVDNERPTSEIIKRFAKEKGLHPREAEAGVTSFFKILMKRGILVVAVH